MRAALVMLAYVAVAWLEVRILLQKRLIRDVIVVLIAYVLTLVPAVLLVSGNDDLPAINTLIRQIVQLALNR